MKFDKFINNTDIIEKYAYLREKFANAQTHAELKFIKKEFSEENKKEDKKVPENIIEMFFKERYKQLGPKFKTQAKMSVIADYSSHDEIRKMMTTAQSLSPNIF